MHIADTPAHNQAGKFWVPFTGGGAEIHGCLLTGRIVLSGRTINPLCRTKLPFISRFLDQSGVLFVLYTVTSSTTAISAIPAIRP